MLTPPINVFRRTLKLSIAGTRGGFARSQILMLLEKRPHTINELSDELSLNYKTIEYHLRVLEKLGLITPPDKKYRKTFELSVLVKANKNFLKEAYDGIIKENKHTK